MSTSEETTLGAQYRCGNCGAQFLVTNPGRLPRCCGKPLLPA